MPEPDTDVLDNEAVENAAEDTAAADSSEGASPPSSEEFLSIRDAARQFGYEDAASFEDDEAALKHLIEKATAEPARPDEQLSQAGRRYLEHASQFEEFLRQREQEQAQPKGEEPTFWDAPEWNPSWQNMVEVDPDSGLLRPVNGGTMETANKVQRYLDYRRDQQEKFWSNPYGYLDPYFEHREKQFEDRVQERIERALEAERARAQARNFVSANNDWLWEKDSQGNVRMADGKPVLTEDGVRLEGYLQRLYGLPQDEQAELAMKLLEADRIRSGKETPDRKREEKNKSILMNAAKSGGDPAKQPPAGNEQEEEVAEQDLAAMLREQFAAEGITDETIREEILSH